MADDDAGNPLRDLGKARDVKKGWYARSPGSPTVVIARRGERYGAFTATRYATTRAHSGSDALVVDVAMPPRPTRAAVISASRCEAER